jgi:hypothetical protein
MADASDSDVSKADLRKLLEKHEERETEDQEKAESKEEQRLEERAGLHEDHEKKAFWRGFNRRGAW